MRHESQRDLLNNLEFPYERLTAYLTAQVALFPDRPLMLSLFEIQYSKESYEQVPCT